MALFKRLFFRKPPDRLLEIAERVYVFNCCFSKYVIREDEYNDYTTGIIAQLQAYHPDASFMVCNFRERDKRSQISDILSGFDIVVMDYPIHSEVCPLLPLVMIQHFLRSCESWLSMEGINNVLLMHCDRGGWPVLAFMLASLLLNMKHYTTEQKTLEMMYKQAPKELLFSSPLNPQPSHLRYLQYISRCGSMSAWPPSDAPFTLECLILKGIPRFDGEGGCRTIVRISQLNDLTTSSSSPKTVFATPRTKKHIHHYRQEDDATMKINFHCCVQGDVVIECLHLDQDLEHEEMMFRVMFNTAFVQSKIWALTGDEIDITWSAKDQFPRDFKIEVVFSDFNAFDCDTSSEPVAEQGDDTECTFTEASEEFFEAEEVFSSPDWNDTKKDPDALTHEAKRDPKSSEKETYSSTEMWISREENSGQKVGYLEAENLCETRNSKDDKKILPETLVGLDIMVPFEDKAIIESSILPPRMKDNCCNSTSIAEEKALDIRNKQVRIGDIKVPIIVESTAHKLEASSMTGTLKMDICDSKNNMDKITSSRSTAIDDGPSSEIFCYSADKDSVITEDIIDPKHDSSFGTMSINKNTSELWATNTDSEKIDEMFVFTDNKVMCEDKSVLEARSFENESKDIFTLYVEDGNATVAHIYKHVVNQLNTCKMINLHELNYNSDARILTNRAQCSVDQSECKLNPEIVVNGTNSTHSDKGHNIGAQDIVSGTMFKAGKNANKDDTEKGITETKITAKVTGQKTLEDGKIQKREQSSQSISVKMSTCTRPHESDISKPKIKQQERVGDPVDSANPKTVFQQITPKKISENTAVHIPSIDNLTDNIGNVAGDSLVSASINGASNSVHSLSPPSQLQARPPLPPPPLPPYLGASSSSFFTDTYCGWQSLTPPFPPKLAKVTVPVSTSDIMTKVPTSQPLLTFNASTPPPPPALPPLSPPPLLVQSCVSLPLPCSLVTFPDSLPPPDNPHVISGASVKSVLLSPPPPPPPPPPPSPSCPRSRMKGPVTPQSPLTPPLINNASVVCPTIPSSLSNQRGKIQGPPPPPPPPHRPNTSIYVSHPPNSAISGKCLGPPSAPPLAPPLKSSMNSSKLPGSRAPIPSPPLPSTFGGAPSPPPALGAHAGAPPPPPPPRARTPNRRGSPCARRSPSPTMSARPLSHLDARGLFPRHGIILPTTPSSLAPRKSSLKPLHWVKITRAVQGSLWAELQKTDDALCASEFDVSELERHFSAMGPRKDNSSKTEGHHKALGSKLDKVHLIDLRRANNTEIMLTQVKMPHSDLMSAVLAMDDSILDVDQVENLLKFCPTKEEMELLKGYSGDREKLGKCEQYFLELMKIPRVESKLRVYSFKIQFGSQVSDIKTSLNTIDSICEQVFTSVKLKEIMKKILFLGNTINQGTARGSAIGFHLESLLKLIDTRAINNRMTLMHYLCKVIAEKSPHLLSFHEDIASLEAASKIQLKYLAEEMQDIAKGLEKVELELQASENDGPVSEVFHKTLKEFTAVAGAEVQSLTSRYAAVGKNADVLALYFGEDPARCPFEQVVSALLNFTLQFQRAHQENCIRADLMKKKAGREGS